MVESQLMIPRSHISYLRVRVAIVSASLALAFGPSTGPHVVLQRAALHSSGELFTRACTSTRSSLKRHPQKMSTVTRTLRNLWRIGPRVSNRIAPRKPRSAANAYLLLGLWTSDAGSSAPYSLLLAIRDGSLDEGSPPLVYESTAGVNSGFT